LNLDIDMIDIGETGLHIFKPAAHTIKCVQFTRDNCCEFWYRTESHELSFFRNATEIYVVLCKDGHMSHYHGASQEYGWPCGNENVVFVDWGAG
jgi:hypothetical protein